MLKSVKFLESIVSIDFSYGEVIFRNSGSF